MSYEQFVHAIYECARSRLLSCEKIEMQEILKNNGVTAIGLTIRKQDSKAAPVIYLEEFYQYFIDGMSLEKLADILIEKSRSAVHGPRLNYEDIYDFSKIRNRVVYKLINAEKNKKLLSEVPNLPLFDLAIVFCWVIPAGEEEYGSVLIRNTHMNLWNLPISVLYECAKQNTPRMFPYVFASLSEYIRDAAGFSVEESPLHILSNQSGIYGASAILYPEIPGKIYKILRKKYYLLPASVHEFLIIPENEGIKPENLRAMVREVNETQIKEEELLSDHIYCFDGQIITKM